MKFLTNTGILYHELNQNIADFCAKNGEVIGAVADDRELKFSQPSENGESENVAQMSEFINDLSEAELIQGAKMASAYNAEILKNYSQEIQKGAQKVEQITMRQARLALHAAGVLSQVESAIESFNEPLKTTAKIEWEYGNSVERDSVLIAEFAKALKLDEAKIDELFLQASKL